MTIYHLFAITNSAIIHFLILLFCLIFTATVSAENPPRLFKTLPYYHNTPIDEPTTTPKSTPTQAIIPTPTPQQQSKTDKSTTPTEQSRQSKNTIKIKATKIKRTPKSHSPPVKKNLFSTKNWIQDDQKREWIIHENKWQAKP